MVGSKLEPDEQSFVRQRSQAYASNLTSYHQEKQELGLLTARDKDQRSDGK